MERWTHVFWRGFRLAAVLLVLSGCGFVGLSWISAIWPTEGRLQASASGPAIHVCAGAVHTDFAVPIELARSERFGELADVIPETLPSDAYALMGWGDYRFFTEVPYASDLRPGVALGALLGRHQTALRIMFVREAGLPELCLELPLDAAGQGAIAQHILETVGEPEILSDSSDRMLYLKSNRRYGVFQTCNDWTSDALRQAGLPTARWIAPFAFSVTWPLRGLSG